jgi:hypothetical protein
MRPPKNTFEEWKASGPPLPPGERKGGRPSKGGVHKDTKTLADGTRAVYWYAYKGGPRISDEQAEIIRSRGERPAAEG